MKSRGIIWVGRICVIGYFTAHKQIYETIRKLCALGIRRSTIQKPFEDEYFLFRSSKKQETCEHVKFCDQTKTRSLGQYSCLEAQTHSRDRLDMIFGGTRTTARMNHSKITCLDLKHTKGKHVSMHSFQDQKQCIETIWRIFLLGIRNTRIAPNPFD